VTVTYDWRTDTTTVTAIDSVDLIYDVTGDFSVITTMVQAPSAGGSAGIKVTDGSVNLLFSVGPLAGDNIISVPVGVNFLVLQWTSGTYTPFTSSDGVVWHPLVNPKVDVDGNPLPFPEFPTTPTQAGLFFQTDPSTTVEETAVYGSPRVLPGTILAQLDDPDHLADWIIYPETETLAPIGLVPPKPPDPVTSSAEATVHAFVGAPFGDLEFDVGKSVGWLNRFVDDLFVTDVNAGTQRYWVVNWTASFHDTYYKFSGKSFFLDPVAYRKGQVQDALDYSHRHPEQLVYDDNDWVIFLDAHEGLSTDTRSKPDDYLISTYQSFIYREIARANDSGLDRVVLPFYVFLRHDHIQNVSQTYTDLDDRLFVVTQSAGVPYYLPNLGMTRMFRVSVLRDPDFDWSIIDTPVAIPDTTVKIQLVSYAYAHWSLQDIPPKQARVPPLSPGNDDGWLQRCLISQVVPITGLPFGDPYNPITTWVHPVEDVAGFRGPWCFDTYAELVDGAEIPYPPPPIDPEVAGLMTPMYDLVFRINVRDGVWYAGNGVGNTQLIWSDDLQEFIAYGQPIPEPIQFTENPPGSGLYEADPALVGANGLYEIPTGIIEDPLGSGLYDPRP
jgi:hypothetical protein